MKICVIECAVLLVACAALVAAKEAGCDIVCLAVVDPVCGVGANGVPRTFNNGCYLDLYNCQNPNDRYEEVYKGECRELGA